MKKKNTKPLETQNRYQQLLGWNPTGYVAYLPCRINAGRFSFQQFNFLFDLWQCLQAKNNIVEGKLMKDFQTTNAKLSKHALSLTQVSTEGEERKNILSNMNLLTGFCNWLIKSKLIGWNHLVMLKLVKRMSNDMFRIVALSTTH